MDRRKGFDLYHTEIVIIRKEVCPTVKFENIDQVTFNNLKFKLKMHFHVLIFYLYIQQWNLELLLPFSQIYVIFNIWKQFFVLNCITPCYEINIDVNEYTILTGLSTTEDNQYLSDIFPNKVFFSNKVYLLCCIL